MSCKFKVGETYPMRGGGECKVVHIDADGLISQNGELYQMIGVYSSPKWLRPSSVGYDLSGKAIAPFACTDLDLMPSSEKVWVVVWKSCANCGTKAKTFASSVEAENWARFCWSADVIGPAELDALGNERVKT